MTAEQTTGPLAVFHDSETCDAKHRHEINIISDGTMAYAYGETTDPVEPVYRDGVALSVTCAQPTNEGPCQGRVEVSIDRPGTWTASPTARRLLASLGQAVER